MQFFVLIAALPLSSCYEPSSAAPLQPLESWETEREREWERHRTGVTLNEPFAVQYIISCITFYILFYASTQLPFPFALQKCTLPLFNWVRVRDVFVHPGNGILSCFGTCKCIPSTEFNWMIGIASLRWSFTYSHSRRASKRINGTMWQCDNFTQNTLHTTYGYVVCAMCLPWCGTCSVALKFLWMPWSHRRRRRRRRGRRKTTKNVIRQRVIPYVCDREEERLRAR